MDIHYCIKHNKKMNQLKTKIFNEKFSYIIKI